MPNTSKHQIRFEKLDSTFLSIFVFFSQFSFQIGLHVAQEYEKKKSVLLQNCLRAYSLCNAKLRSRETHFSVVPFI